MSTTPEKPVSVMIIDEMVRLVRGHDDGGSRIVDAVNGDLLLDDNGNFALPPLQTNGLIDLIASGRLQIRPLPAALEGTQAMPAAVCKDQSSKAERRRDAAARRRLTACLLCDAAKVANGDKAIERFMHSNWTPELVARFGPAPKPRTIRFWRSRLSASDGRSFDDFEFPEEKPGAPGIFSDAVESILLEIAQECVEGLSVEVAHGRLQNAVEALAVEGEGARDGCAADRLRVPSRRSLRRRIAALKRQFARIGCNPEG